MKPIEKRSEIVGYIRVSTDLQNIGKQRETLKHYSKLKGLTITKFIEVEVSSTKSVIQRRLDLLDALEEGDVLICTETSRLSRSLLELLTIVDDLLRRNVRLIFIMQNLDLIDLKDPSTRLQLNMFSVMAEHERSVVSQRTKEALRVLKERGVRLGKPKGTIQRSIFDIHLSKIKEYCRIGLSYGKQTPM